MASTKKILITGATQGLGLTLARKLIAAGQEPIVVGRSVEKVEEALRSLFESTSIEVEGKVGKLVDRESALVLSEQVGDIDVLINNAGLWQDTPFLDVDEDEIEDQLGLLKATFFLTQAIARKWVKCGKKGVIINIGSIWGERAVGKTPSSSHSIAKAGLHQLTKNVAQELGKYGIRINTIAPGVITESATQMNDIHALRRVGSYEDVAHMVLFLTDHEKSNWITGAIFHVDGGASALIDNGDPL